MKLPTVVKKYTIKPATTFEPLVVYGSYVQIGQPIARGSYYKVLQEIPLNALGRILVDPGVFVTKGQLLGESVEFLRKKQWFADVDGVVHITDYSLQIVDVIDEHEYISEVSGRVTLATNDEIVIEGNFFKLDMFASHGDYVKGYIRFLDAATKIVTTKNVPLDLARSVLVINGMLTHQIVLKAISANALGIIGTSIEWQEYQRLGALSSKINIGVLQGFGQFFMLTGFQALFNEYKNSYIEVDFANEVVYLPAKSIVWTPDKVYVFSGDRWGIPVQELALRHNAKNSNALVFDQEKFVV